MKEKDSLTLAEKIAGEIVFSPIPGKTLRKWRDIFNVKQSELAFYLDTDASAKPHESLSNREYQTLCMIASGKTTKQIAEELALSSKTISTYRERILEKMNMNSNSELTYYAIKNNLVM